MSKPRHVFIRFLTFSFKAYPRYYFLVILSTLIATGQALFTVYSLSLLIQGLEQNQLQTALNVGILIVGVNLLFNLLDKWARRIQDYHLNALVEAVNRRVGQKLMGVEFQLLEDPQYLDLKERAKFAIENQMVIYALLNRTAELVKLVMTFIGLLALLVTFDSLLVVGLIIAIGLNVLILFASMKIQLNFFQKLIPINRRFTYYLGTLLDEKNAKDFRMYSVGKLLIDQFAHYGRETATYFEGLGKQQGFFEALSEVVKYTQMAAVYAFVAIKTLTLHLPISSFTLYISSALAFSTTVSSLIDTGMNYFRNYQYIKPFVELINVKEVEESGKRLPFKGPIHTIRFDHVNFAYPRSEQNILKDISFEIHQGEKISIVGLNGAGKTTLVKLLCRLYQPSSGTIYVNEQPIQDYNFNDYIKQLTAVFQDFKLFAYSIKENILNANGDPKEAYEVAAKVGLKEKIDSLPQGIESLYTKSFSEEGIELSGGEAQKVAIARALHSQGSLVILDEPTSALDPLAEAEIYQHFNELVKEKTAIYISHRMSSSVFCDRILVIENGSITDFDTHKNLMKKKNSLYYKMFSSQAKNYQE